MLRSILLVLILNCLATPGFSKERNFLNNIWVGEKLEYLEIRSDTLISEIHTFHVSMCRFKLMSDTLFISQRDLRDTDAHIDEYVPRFIVQKSDSLTLILKSVYAFDSIPVHCVPKSKLIDRNFHFQKIQFTSSNCYGDCPAYKMSIDSVGQIYLEVGWSKWVKSGYYKSQLSKKKLNELCTILKSSAVDRFPENRGQAIDAPSYSFVFYYNNKIKKSFGSKIPYFSRELLYYLILLPPKLRLKQTKERMVFERTTVDRFLFPPKLKH